MAAGSTIDKPDPNGNQTDDPAGGKPDPDEGDKPGGNGGNGANTGDDPGKTKPDPGKGNEPGGEGDDEGGNGDEGGDESGRVHYGFALCSSEGVDNWGSYYVFVGVRATDGAATEIAEVYGDDEGLVDPSYVYSPSENSIYLTWSIDGKFGGVGYRMKSVVKQIQEKIESNVQVANISTVSGATRSSRAIIEAYEMAAANAQAGVATTPQEAVQLEAAAGGADPSLAPGIPVL